MIIQARKKPVVIEAVKWEGLNHMEVKNFCGEHAIIEISDAAWEVGMAPPMVYITIKTLEGNMVCKKGDYIIKGVNGEFYPCKPDIFHKTYDII